LVPRADEDMENHGADLWIVIEDVCGRHSRARDTTTVVQQNFMDENPLRPSGHVLLRAAEPNAMVVTLPFRTVLAGR
jgi:hypothetical protein